MIKTVKRDIETHVVHKFGKSPSSQFPDARNDSAARKIFPPEFILHCSFLVAVFHLLTKNVPNQRGNKVPVSTSSAFNSLALGFVSNPLMFSNIDWAIYQLQYSFVDSVTLFRAFTQFWWFIRLRAYGLWTTGASWISSLTLKPMLGLFLRLCMEEGETQSLISHLHILTFKRKIMDFLFLTLSCTLALTMFVQPSISHMFTGAVNETGPWMSTSNKLSKNGISNHYQ